MSILFIVYSACLLIKESILVEENGRLTVELPILKTIVHQIKKLNWNIVNYCSLFSLLWLGILCLHAHRMMFVSIESKVWFWISFLTISTGICVVLYFLHEKWIPQLVKGIEKKQSKHKVSDYEGNHKLTFNLGEKIAREVMTPRLDMICLERKKSIEDNISIAVKYMRTRYPVVNEDKDDIIGFIHIKDLLGNSDNNNPQQQWNKWIRPIITVPDSIPISSLLGLMQKKKTQISLLIDEYGGTSGMATLEDIIEEIVGDIQDEFDVEEHDIVNVRTDYYQISAKLLIEEVNSYFNISLEAEEMDSIGGYMYANIQFPPHIGQSVTFQSKEYLYSFTIEKMDQLRITAIGVHKAVLEKKYENSLAD